MDNIDLYRNSVREIEEDRHDPEAAHAGEDGLYLTFLNDIAGGGIATIEEAREIAAVCLETQKIRFARYTA